MAPFGSHSRLEELQREAAVKALERARRLAEALAQAQGSKSKGWRRSPPACASSPYRGAGELSDGHGGRRAGPTPIEVGEEEIKANVQVVFW